MGGGNMYTPVGQRATTINQVMSKLYHTLTTTVLN